MLCFIVRQKLLVVADLLFNLHPEVSRWTRFFLQVTAGINEYPGMSRLFRMMIKNRELFIASMGRLASLDFDRLIVGHGEVIENEPKAALLKLLEQFELAPK